MLVRGTEKHLSLLRVIVDVQWNLLCKATVNKVETAFIKRKPALQAVT